MARLPRNVVPGQALHVIQRGNNRQAVFFSDTDYRYYHEALLAAADEYGCAIHAYVFMPNHVHLLLTPQTENGPSRMMQSVGGRYVRYVNSVYQRTGTLWDGRFKSAIIDYEQYLLSCCRYIELNPVRAAMVLTPGEYRWSSYRHNAQGEPDELLIPHSNYLCLADNEEHRCQSYAALFSSPEDAEQWTKLRIGTEACGIVGDSRFREQVQQALQRRVEKFAHGGDRKSKRWSNHVIRATALTP